MPFDLGDDAAGFYPTPVAGEKIDAAIALLKEYREPERTQAFEEAKARMEAAPWNSCLKGVEE
jgi:hypothetical protein